MVKSFSNPHVKKILGSKKAERITNEFTGKLKNQGTIHLTWETAYSGNPLETVIEFTLKKGKKSSVFSISSSEHDFMYLTFLTELHFVDVTDIIQYVQDIAKAAGYFVLFVSSIEKKLEIPMKDVRSTPISEEDRTDRFCKGFATEGDLLYINLVKNYMEDMLNIIRALEGEIKKQKEKEPTFSCEISYQANRQLQYGYYINGLQDRFILTFDKEMSFSNSKFEENKVLNTPDDMKQAFRDLIEKAEIETKFPALLNPPKKHFTNFLNSKLKQEKEVIEQLFNSLMETIDPKDIEKEFARNAENHYKEIDSEQRFVFIKLMEYYFVVKLQDSEVEKFNAYDTAYSYYEKNVLDKYNKDFLAATKNFKEKLNTLEKV